MSSWFSKFGSLSWVTVAMLAVALAGGILAVWKKKNAKGIMLIAGLAEVGLLAFALIRYLTQKDTAGTAFEDVSMGAWTYTLMIVLLLAVMIGALILSGRREKWTARDLAYAAVCVAMSFVLSYIRLYRMPQGGSITPASMLPMILFIATFGPSKGVAVGFAFGLMQLLQGAYVIHPVQLLVDYPMAYGAMALAGLAGVLRLPKAVRLPAAVLLAYAGRYVMATLSGAVFFAESAGEQNAWIYSLVYNLSYLGPDCLVCAAVALIPGFSRLSGVMKKR